MHLCYYSKPYSEGNTSILTIVIDYKATEPWPALSPGSEDKGRESLPPPAVMGDTGPLVLVPWPGIVPCACKIRWLICVCTLPATHPWCRC